jgi:hypothetical protein
MTARLRAHWPVVVALVVVVIGRVLLFRYPPYPDEAGFYLVARDLLEHGGDGLYGHYWVDRPPTLIALYSIGAATGEVRAMRVLVAVMLLVFVTVAWLTVRRLGASAAWAVAVAAAFAISPAVGAETANGEAFALPFVMVGLYCVVRVTQTPGRAALPWALAAGFAGMLATTVKQNFADVFVFAIVLLVGLGLRRQRTWVSVAQQLGAGVAGAAAAVGLMVAYALTTPVGVPGLWLAAVEFRTEANRVLAAGDRTGIEIRIDAITLHAWLAGLVPFVAVLLLMALRRRLRVSPLSYAIGALIVFEIVCIVVGGNFWSHYLMGLAPGLLLAAGIWARHLPVALVSTYVVGSALVAVPVALHDLSRNGPDRAQAAGRLVRESSEPGDTATVLFGKADLQWATGMRSPYEHLWSLPVRTLDPDLDELTDLLASDDAPTWVVLTFGLHTWELDPARTIDPVFKERYGEVWEGCDVRVYLLRGVERPLASYRPGC